MPINSKYSNQQVETVIADLLAVLNRHEANVELSLMCLGNATSHIINHQIAREHQQNVIDSFKQALQATIKN